MSQSANIRTPTSSITSPSTRRPTRRSPTPTRTPTSGGGSRPSTPRATCSPGRTPAQVHQGDAGRNPQPGRRDRRRRPRSRRSTSHVTSGEFPFRWTANRLRRDVEDRGLQGRRHHPFARASGSCPATSKQAALRAAFVAAAVPRCRTAGGSSATHATGEENKGRWSGLGRFWVDPAPVNLVSPNPPVRVSTSERRRAEVGTLYEVGELQGGESTPSTSAILRATRAWRLGLPRPPRTRGLRPSTVPASGTYSVDRSLLFDASGNAMGISPTRTFVVNTALTATPGVQIQSPDGAGVGKTTSVAPTWNQPGVSNTYQWLRNGSTISGATATTYDHGRPGQVDHPAGDGQAAGLHRRRQRVERDHCHDRRRTRAHDAYRRSPVSRPPRRRSPQTSGVWPGSASKTYAYQWFVNGQAVAKATGKTYVVRTLDAGQPISVRVTMTMNGTPSLVRGAAPRPSGRQAGLDDDCHRGRQEDHPARPRGAHRQGNGDG